jgi:DNA modification methylase
LIPEWAAIHSLRPYPAELRRHSRRQISKLRRSIDRYAQVVPIIVSSTGEIIDGHAIWEALKANGAAEVLVVRVSHLNDAEVRALRLQLNRAAQDAVWQKPQLKAEIGALLEIGFDLDLTGFETVEIDNLLNLDIPGANVVEDAETIPPLADRAVAQLGQIFQLNNHRLGCGDAVDLAFVKSVCDQRKVDCVFTDPPYNLKIDGVVTGNGKHRHREFVQAAGEMPKADFCYFLRERMEVLISSCADHAVIFVCMDWRHSLELLVAAEQLKLPHINTAVWAKTNPGMGTLYRSQHEFVHIFKAGEKPHRNNIELGRFGRNRSNLWTYAGMTAFGKDRDELLSSHPTVKPVPLIADAIRDVTRRGDLILDSFCGSGSTIIAAEETGRLCCAVELDPLYVDVAIRRWQNVTGCDAVCVNTGETFNSIAERRLLKSDRDNVE